MDEHDGTRLAIESVEVQRKLKRLLYVKWNSVRQVKTITADLESIASGLRKLVEEIELNNPDDKP